MLPHNYQVEDIFATKIYYCSVSNCSAIQKELLDAYDKIEFDRIKKASEKIKNDSEVLIVIGIGGSYLGARAAIDFLSHSFYNNQKKCFR